MLKWALITDLHFGVRNDSKVFYNVFRKFYSENFIPHIKKNKIKTVVILGDVFDRRKFINFETLNLAKECLFDPLRELGVSVHMLLGNHDVYYKNTNSINSIQALLGDYKNITIYVDPKEALIDDVKVLMLPWINQENSQAAVDLLKSTEAKYVMSHLEMKGFEYHRGFFSDRGHFDEVLFGRFDFVFSGHYHHKSSKGNIHYLGTPYELMWSDYGDPKGFHVFNGKKFTFVENEDRVFIRLVYDDGGNNHQEIEKSLEESFGYLMDKYVKVIIKRKTDPILFERFLDSVLESIPTDVNVIDETNTLIETSTELKEEAFKDTLDIVGAYVEEELQTSLDKDVLVRYMHSLYSEASKFSEVE